MAAILRGQLAFALLVAACTDAELDPPPSADRVEPRAKVELEVSVREDGEPAGAATIQLAIPGEAEVELGSTTLRVVLDALQLEDEQDAYLLHLQRDGERAFETRLLVEEAEEAAVEIQGTRHTVLITVAIRRSTPLLAARTQPVLR